MHPNLKQFYLYIFFVAVGYAAAMYTSYLAKENVSLVDIVTIGKILSLFILLIVNGELAKDIDKSQKDIKIVNIIILVTVILIIIVTIIKLLDLNISESSASFNFKMVLNYLYENIFWISAFPLIAYAFLDYYIAYLRKASSFTEKSIAIKFFIFVDLTCIFPLVLVYIITALHSEFFVSTPVGVEIFTSGSMAIVLMSSAIGAKAVKEYFSEPEGTSEGGNHNVK